MKHLLTSHLTLLLAAGLALAQGAYYRTADGTWAPLPTTAAGKLLKFSLTPEQVGAAGTVLVLDKPDWMVLEDAAAPALMKALVDGQEVAADALELGYVAIAPGEFACAIQDQDNPLDLDGVQVHLDGRPVPATRVKLQNLTPDRKMARLAVTFGELPAAQHELRILVADRSPAHNLLQLKLTFNSAPLVLNGSFEEVLPDGKPVNWQCGAWSTTPDTAYEMDVRPGGVAGNQALRIKGLAGSLNLVCFQEKTNLRPGDYVMTGSYKGAGGGALTAYGYDGDQQVGTLMHQLPGVADWTAFTWEFTLPAQKRTLLVVRTGSKEETWFDDIRLDPKP